MALFEEALSLKENLYEAIINIGLAHKILENFDEAIEWYDKAIK